MVVSESQLLGEDSRLNSRRKLASIIGVAVNALPRFLWVTCTFIYTFYKLACQVSRNNMCPGFWGTLYADSAC